MKKIALMAVVAAIAGCTTLTDAGSKVRVVTAQEKSSCQFLRLVSTRAGLGPNKPGSALKAALNETAEAGGNGFFLVTSHQDLFDGASVSGEALRCK